MRMKPSRALSFILSGILAMIFLSGCGQNLQPVSANSISEFDDGKKLTHADAVSYGLPTTVWGFKGATLTSGPFKGWKIDTDEKGSFIGLNVYMVSRKTSSTVQDFYNNELSDDKWDKGDDVSGDGFSGFSWKRGSQAFVAVVIEDSPALASDGSHLSLLITYLLNK